MTYIVYYDPFNPEPFPKGEEVFYKDPFDKKIVTEDDYNKLIEEYYSMFNETPKAHPDRNVKPLEKQVGGDHYKTMKIQPIEFIQANGLGFCEGNAIKYLCRYKDKGGVEDLKKARHYIDLLIDGYKDD